MVHIITSGDANWTYDHAAASPGDESERDMIFSGAGNDVIYGDDEDAFFYDNGGFDIWDYIFTIAFPFRELGSHTDFGIYDVDGIKRPTVEDARDNEDSDFIPGRAIHFTNNDPVVFDEFIDAGGGNDYVDGRGGNDWIFGGEGHDHLIGGHGDDFLEGGNGNDTLQAGRGYDTVVGGNGNDTIEIIGLGNDYANGNDDFDTLILTNTGSDPFTFDLSIGTGTSTSWQNNELFYAVNFETLSYNGGSGTDTIGGGENGDILNGFGGMDFLEGAGGNDLIDGGDGRDFLTGGSGRDRIYGGVDNDFIDDGDGDDLVFGDDGEDTIVTGAGNDIVHGGAGNDTIKEDTSDDPMLVNSKGFNDVIFGDAGNDTIEGGNGHDWISGGANDDTIRGDSGNDDIDGDAGEDIITGGSGYDRMTGGLGKDTFLFAAADVIGVQGGGYHSNDQIRDFNPEEDTLDLSGIAIYAKGGMLFFDDNDGTPGEAGEIAFRERNGNTELVIDFEGDGVVDFSIEFVGLAYNPGENPLGPNVILTSPEL